MEIHRSIALLAAVQSITPLISQSAWNFPEPVPISTFCELNQIESLIGKNADFWMLVLSGKKLSATYVTWEFVPDISTKDGPQFTVHYTEATLPRSKQSLRQQFVIQHSKNTLSPDYYTIINKIWKTILKHTKYPEQEITHSVMDGSIYYFGYQQKYYGMSYEPATGEAWLIKNIGLELMNYAKANPSEKPASLERIKRLIDESDLKDASHPVSAP
ncbi:hypothetical protein [Geothrix mesophila]|uniref:hypothetical protein n=1 Tax=Geothrix mesophila TaxID=2922723 RepID=UPI001FACB1ED|nr:hypothetical protein [Geothrix sp. SG198]